MGERGFSRCQQHKVPAATARVHSMRSSGGNRTRNCGNFSVMHSSYWPSTCAERRPKEKHSVSRENLSQKYDWVPSDIVSLADHNLSCNVAVVLVYCRLYYTKTGINQTFPSRAHTRLPLCNAEFHYLTGKSMHLYVLTNNHVYMEMLRDMGNDHITSRLFTSVCFYLVSTSNLSRNNLITPVRHAMFNLCCW